MASCEVGVISASGIHEKLPGTEEGASSAGETAHSHSGDIFAEQ